MTITPAAYRELYESAIRLTWPEIADVRRQLSSLRRPDVIALAQAAGVHQRLTTKRQAVNVLAGAIEQRKGSYQRTAF